MELSDRRVNLLHTRIHSVDLLSACSTIESFVRQRTPHQIVTVNLDFLRIAFHDSSFRDVVNSADLVIADGMPLVWASRLQGEAVPERIAGVDLVVDCCRFAAEHGFGVFLLGAVPGVADLAASVLKSRFPTLRVVGTHSPPSLNGMDDVETLARLREARPEILFVAFGAPRQERWIAEHMHALDIPVMMGVGGSFDMISGRVSRAPRWMQGAGLEWLYRFAVEPRRLWKRYFVQDLPTFIRLIAWSTNPVPAPTVAHSLPIDTRDSEVAAMRGTLRAGEA